MEALVVIRPFYINFHSYIITQSGKRPCLHFIQGPIEPVGVDTPTPLHMFFCHHAIWHQNVLIRQRLIRRL